MKYFVMIVGAIAFLSSFQVNARQRVRPPGRNAVRLSLLEDAAFPIRPVTPVRMAYSDWKLQRAKKKFQVYLRKQGPGNPHIH